MSIIFRPGSVCCNRNRNLKTSKALLKSQAHQGTSLFTSAATNQRGVSKGGVKRSSGPNSRVPGGDRVAVRVGVVEMGRGNDQKGSGRAVVRLRNVVIYSSYKLLILHSILKRNENNRPAITLAYPAKVVGGWWTERLRNVVFCASYKLLKN